MTVYPLTHLPGCNRWLDVDKIESMRPEYQTGEPVPIYSHSVRFQSGKEWLVSSDDYHVILSVRIERDEMRSIACRGNL